MILLFVVDPHTSNQEPSRAMQLLLPGSPTQTLCGTWNVINDPIVVIAVLGVQTQLLGVIAIQTHLTQNLEVRIPQHINHVWRGLNLVSCEKFSKVFAGHFGSSVGAAEGKEVVIARKLGV